MVGSYARIRKQFKVPIAEMEGVQESLARMSSQAYVLMSAQKLTNAMLNNHEQPAVISAIMKQQMSVELPQVVFVEVLPMEVVAAAGGIVPVQKNKKQ